MFIKLQKEFTSNIWPVGSVTLEKLFLVPMSPPSGPFEPVHLNFIQLMLRMGCQYVLVSMYVSWMGWSLPLPQGAPTQHPGGWVWRGEDLFTSSIHSSVHIYTQNIELHSLWVKHMLCCRNRKRREYINVSIFYCCITNSYKSSSLKQWAILVSQFLWVRGSSTSYLGPLLRIPPDKV